MKRRFSVVIVGGGITGLTLAALLTRVRHADALDITVMDAAKRPVFSAADEVSLRVSAIASGSQELLDSVAAWSLIRDARVSPYEAMRVWDENESPDCGSALRFYAAEFGVRQLGHIVENVLVQDALLQVLDQSDVTLQFETRIESLPRADLVVGADGARSFVRDRTAWQRFLRDGPLGMLPLADGRISVVWSTTPDNAQQAMSASDDDLGRMLTQASDSVLGELSVAGPRGAFPLCAQHAGHYVQQGVALVGDAAHAIHPLAGQGANLGLQDTAELARVIDTAIENGLHPGDRPVLRRYERARKGPNLTMLHFMTGLNRLFTTDSTILGEIRLAGMRLFNRSGAVRERAVKVALGVR